jgi:DNA topoisomerase-1
MESDSDDVPLAQRVPPPKPAARVEPKRQADTGTKRKAAAPAGAAAKRQKAAAPAAKRGGGGNGARRDVPAGGGAGDSSSDDDDDDDDDDGADAGGAGHAARESKRLAKDRKAVAQMSSVKKGVRITSLLASFCRLGRQARVRRAERHRLPRAQAKKVWVTLEHRGVTFPPAYEPHGVKLLYDGKQVDLTPEEEEVRAHGPARADARAALPTGAPGSHDDARCARAWLQVATFFAVMKDSDYATKKVFVENFWKGFRRVLKGANKETITVFSKCDFTNIYNWHLAEREKKKAQTGEVRTLGPRCAHLQHESLSPRCGFAHAQEKKAAKVERDKAELQYTTAVMDGRVEKVRVLKLCAVGVSGHHPNLRAQRRRHVLAGWQLPRGAA